MIGCLEILVMIIGLRFREWIIENSNGVPRTMVLMAHKLANMGFDYVRQVGLHAAIRELDAQMVQSIDISIINDLLSLKNGREMLEWIVWRSLIEKEIPILGIRRIQLDEAERENICTIDDLIDKGVVHLLNGSVEIRTNYYLLSLKNALGLDHIMLKDLLDISGLTRDEALALSSWQVNVIGAYFEMAVALALFRLSQQGIFNLDRLFSNSNETKVVVPKFERIEKLPFYSSELIKPNVIYAMPRVKGVDITFKDVEGNMVLIECKNWERAISSLELSIIHRNILQFEKEIGRSGIHILVTTSQLSEELLNQANKQKLFVINEMDRLVGRDIMDFFEQALQRARKVEPLMVRTAVGGFQSI